MSELLRFKKISVWSVIGKIVLLHILVFGVLLALPIVVDIGTDMTGSVFSIAVYAGIIFILFRYGRQSGITSKYIIGSLSVWKKGLFTYISIQMLITLFSVASLLALLYWFTGMFEEVFREAITTPPGTEPNAMNVPAAILKISIVLLLAPVAEELLFRGFLFNRWGATMGVGKAMLASSLLFSIVHWDEGLIARFLLGVFFCIVYLKTKQLIIPILLHSFHNFIGAIPGIADGMFSYSGSSGEAPLPLEQRLKVAELILGTGTVLFVILLPVMVYVFYRLYPKGKKATPYERNALGRVASVK